MVKKILLGVGVFIAGYLIYSAYFLYPYFEITHRFDNLPKEFSSIESAQRFCPAYRGQSSSECFLVYVKSYEDTEEVYSLGLTMLMFRGISIIMHESKSIEGHNNRIAHSLRLNDLAILLTQKFKHPSTRSPASRSDTAEISRRATQEMYENSKTNTAVMIYKSKDLIRVANDISDEERKTLLERTDEQFQALVAIAK